MTGTVRRLPLALVLLLIVTGAITFLAPSAHAETFPPRYERSIGGSGRPGVFAWGTQWNPVTNEILVGDYLNFKIRRYDTNGNHLGDFYRPNAYGQPYTIGVDPSDGDIYVGEVKDNPLTRGIAKYDKNGNFLYAIPAGSTSSPTSIRTLYTSWMTVEEDTGDVWLVDSVSAALANEPRIMQLRFDDTTQTVTQVAEWVVTPPDAANTPQVFGIDVSDDDVVYLSDAYNRRAYRYSKDGTHLSTFGQTQTGGDNRGIVVNEALDRVYVVDAEHSDIDVFDRAGAYQFSFAAEGGDAGEFAGGGRQIDIDGAGNVWAADFGGFEVEKYSPTGSPLLTAPAPPRKPPVGLLAQPRDVAVDDATGEVWVADAWAQRFQRFSPTGAPMGAWGQRGPGGPFDMNYPRSIGIQPANTAAMPGPDHPKRIWVVNERGHHIQVYNYPTTATGSPTYFAQIGEIGAGDTEPGHFGWPNDVEFYTRPDGTEIAVIGDRTFPSVKVFNAVTFEELLLDAEGDGPLLARPNYGTAVDPATGYIYIVNPRNDRIEVVDQAGTPVNNWVNSTGTAVNYFGSSGTGDGQMVEPVDAVISNGILYLSDEGLSRVTAFHASTGEYLAKWGTTYGSNIYDFKGAIGIDADAQGRVYVTDTGNDRIQVFNPNAGRQFETTSPAVPTVTSPAQSANLPLAPVSFTGTVTDNVAVGQVEVSVQDYTTGKWWNAFNQSWETAQTSAIAAWSGTSATSVNWRWTFLGVSSGGRYIAHFKTRDHNANLSQVVVRTFAMPGVTPPPVPPPPVLDTTRPNGTQTAPTAAQVLPLAPVNFTGTATDNVGVTSVRIAIKNLANGRWLRDPNSTASSAFSTAFTWHETTLETPGGPSTNWSWVWNSPPAAGGNFQTLVEARDAAGNVDSSKPQVSFSTTNLPPDTTAPETVLTEPAAEATFTALPVAMSGSATDDRSVAAVRLTIQNDSGLYWNGTGWSASPTTVNAALATPNTTSTTWSYAFDPGVNGSFTVSAAAIDAGSNLDTSPGTSDFTIDAPPVPDTVAPNGTVTVPTANQVFPNGQIAFSGDATDNVVVSSVQLAIRNRTTGQWFNGTGWQASFIWFTNATLTSPGSAATGWNYTWAPPAGAGSYLIQARANDAAANFDPTRPSVNFSVTG